MRVLRRTAAWALAVAIVGCSLASCSLHDPRSHCSPDRDCDSNDRCYHGYCIPAHATGLDGGRSLDSGLATGTAADGGRPDHASGSAGSTGSVSNGVKQADAATTSPDAAISSESPDASGPCQAGDVRSCSTKPESSGPLDHCSAGSQRCMNGMFGECVLDTPPGVEACNGIDDDCDGVVDNDTDVSCYPQGQAGCTSQDNKSWMCHGACNLGKQRCLGGQLQPCTGATTPMKEFCTTTGVAADEDCDGAIDEQCACTGTAVTTCYTGPSGTLRVGKCMAGTQACKNGMLDTCMGAVLPQAETCDNEGADDDCDAVQDNIPTRNNMCTASANVGSCQIGTLQCQVGKPNLVCVTHTPVDETCNLQDDDCDGKVDETFNLQSDAANCGTCGHACATSESCCSGRCVNPQSDAANCGMCGHTCLSGARPACCNGSCADLLGNDNCGMCGHACGLLGGVVCNCAMTSSGTGCMAPLGLCL